jgi:F420 biosynthesis protein FbiB-like protein
MDFHKFLRSRRSIRNLKPDPIPDTVLRNILTTSTYAPSSHNRQPWRFAVLTSDAIKLKLANEMALDFHHDLEKDLLSENEILSRIEKSRTQIVSSPVIIILCMDVSEMDHYPDARRAEAERVMAIQSTANAGLQFLLAAHGEGLGCVWTCSPLFTPITVQTILDLPIAWEPQALFFVGYPEESQVPRKRKSLDEISKFI